MDPKELKKILKKQEANAALQRDEERAQRAAVGVILGKILQLLKEVAAEYGKREFVVRTEIDEWGNIECVTFRIAHGPQYRIHGHKYGLGSGERWSWLVRQFSGLAKVDRVAGYAANFSMCVSIA